MSEDINLEDLKTLEYLCAKYVAVTETKVICRENVERHTEWFKDLLVEMEIGRYRWSTAMISLHIEAAFRAKESAKS